MKISAQIAKHLKELYFGGNWTYSNFKQHLNGLTWQQATAKIQDFNTIATLVFHTAYYIRSVTKVLEGGKLDSSDTESFKHPPILSQQDWDNLLNDMWADCEKFVRHIEQIPDEKLWENFTDQKYGSYYRNLHGIIEHSHYHLGQIVLLKKMVASG